MSRVASSLAGTMAKVGIGLGAGALFVDNAIYTVEPGHRGIIFDRMSGIKNTVAGEGAHFAIPVVQRPIIMDVRTIPRTISSVTGTKDLQQVSLSLRVLSRPREDKLPQIYQKLGVDYGERVLPSVGNEVLKAIVAKYNADQLITLREQISKEIRENMTTRCNGFDLILDDISITHLSFSSEFARAIEAKQVAEQMAERAKFVVAKAEQEKMALIVRSEGDAEAAHLVSSALKQHGQGLIELRRIETATSVADSLARNKNVSYLPNAGGMLLNLPAQ